MRYVDAPFKYGFKEQTFQLAAAGNPGSSWRPK
jgi:hypothetical protein